MEQRDKRLGRLVVLMGENGYGLDEASDLLGVPSNELAELRMQYRQEYAYYRVWGPTKKHGPNMLLDAVLTWAKENGRWPQRKDLRLWNGLPSPSVFDYYTGGWRVQRVSFWDQVAERAHKLDIQLVLTIPNLTARRNAIERIGGHEAVIRRGGGRLMQQDDYGKLWRVDERLGNERDSWAQFVEVVNSTARPDGEFDHYFLRVPPGVTTAKEGVAWTGWFELSRFGGDREARSLGRVHEFEGFVAQS